MGDLSSLTAHYLTMHDQHVYVDLESYGGITRALSGRFTPERSPIEEVERSNMARKEVVRNRIKELEEEYELLNKWGDDNFANGTVLKLKVRYNETNTKWYTFAFIKIDGKWFSSGVSGAVAYATWDQFVEWLADKYAVKGLKMATGWTGI